MIRSELKVVGGEQHGSVIPLSAEKFLIGREDDCHLRPNSESISRHHCAFEIDNYSVHLRDLGSTNGTLVNGQRIQGLVKLRSQDRVAIGNLELEIIIHEASQVQLNDACSAPAVAPATGDTTPLSEPTNVSESTSFETIVKVPFPDVPVGQANAETTVFSVRLPDPAATGVPEVTDEDKESDESKGSDGSSRDNPAADIIRKYRNRRGT